MTTEAHPDVNVDVDAVATRSLERITASMPAESPLVDTNGEEHPRPCCPWCRKPMTVRMTTLHGDAYDEERDIWVERVRLKHTGDAGCHWLPEFHVPHTADSYGAELERRDGQRRIDVALDRVGDDVDERLRALGYIE